MSLFISNRAVLHAPRDDEQLARAERDVSFAHLDRYAPLQDQEEVIGFVVPVPDEGPLVAVQET